MDIRLCLPLKSGEETGISRAKTTDEFWDRQRTIPKISRFHVHVDQQRGTRTCSQSLLRRPQARSHREAYKEGCQRCTRTSNLPLIQCLRRRGRSIQRRETSVRLQTRNANLQSHRNPQVRPRHKYVWHFSIEIFLHASNWEKGLWKPNSMGNSRQNPNCGKVSLQRHQTTSEQDSCLRLGISSDLSGLDWRTGWDVDSCEIRS